jgi:PAS domain S-box-containing protein
MNLNPAGDLTRTLLTERYRQIIEQVADYAIFTLDNDGKITSWNVGAERVLGFTEEDVLGTSSVIIFTTEDRDEGVPEAELETARISGRARDDRWHLRKDGSRFWASGSLNALYDVGGKLDGFCKILRDLTKQHQAEEERKRLINDLKALNDTLEEQVEARTRDLQLSQERFYQAFNAGPVAAVITTRGNPREETFIEVNDAVMELTGYTREEIIAKTAATLAMWSSPEDQAKLRQFGEGDFRNQEFSLRTRRGEVLTILLSRVAVGTNGDRFYLKQFYDITERKRNETHLKAALHRVMRDANWFAEKVMEELAEVQLSSEDTGSKVHLSAREREVLERIARGLANEAIAQDLGLKTQTVRNYISTIYEKIGVNSRAEAVVWARERGMS